jgi:UDP-glucose 4-epimerase
VNVLVTGGAGFIGSHLADRLLETGHAVVALDDLSTGSLSNIAHLAGRPGFRHVIGSVTDEALVAELVAWCDLTVHLAAAVGVRLVVERPVRTIQTNVHGTEVALAAAARTGRKIVIASTSEVYGKSTRTPYAEDGDLVLGSTANARWAYACSKALDEWLALAHARETGTPVIVTRLFNTVGPRQTGRYGMVLPSLAAQAVAGTPLTVFGTGEQSRCFAHVKDVVEAIRRLAEEPAAVGQVVNVGTDREVTINRLAEMVREAAGSTSPIVHVPYEAAYAKGFEDMARRVPDLAKLERLIGCRPSTSLEEIVADVVADQRGRLARE